VKQYFFVGDTHGDLDFVAAAINRAREHGAEIVQVGDWGFLWPDNDQLLPLANKLVAAGVTMRFVDGNHDNHPALRRLFCGANDRGVTIAPNVIYQPRGSVHEDVDGTRFLFLGGAPSIDRASRVAGVSWWPEEVIKMEELAWAREANGPIHVLVTHDANAMPPGFSAKGSATYQRQQQISMAGIDALICQHRPERHVHGHWHARYDREHANTGTITHGLGCNTMDSSYLDEATLLWSRGDAWTPWPKDYSGYWDYDE